MMGLLRGLAFAGSFIACAAVQAQQPDCTVLARTATSGLHASGVVVTPGRALTLEAHCNYGSNDPAPMFQWVGGGSSFDKAVTAPSTPGTSSAFSVTVTQFGASRVFSTTVNAAAAGTPMCTIDHTPAGTIPVFAPLSFTAQCDNATGYQWTGGYDLRTATSRVGAMYNVVNGSGVFIPGVDLVPSNANGTGALVEAALQFALAPPSCRITASPPGLASPNAAVTLTADCDGTPASYAWSTGAATRTITVTPTVAQTEYSVSATNAAGTGQPARHAVSVMTISPPVNLHTAHWWGGASESGWGVTLNEHGSVIFGVIYYYEPSGKPTWAVMPGGTWDTTHTVYTGDLYVPSGAPYTSYDVSQFAANTAMGNVTLEFANDGSLYLSGNMGYAGADGFGQHTTKIAKRLSTLVINSGTNPAGANYADMWWGGAAQNGWGISINQSGNTIFAAWFTYGADHRPSWFIFQGSDWSGSTVNGIIYRTTGAPMLGVAYNAAANVASTAGTGTMTFSAPDRGTFNYTIDGVAGSKAIEKQPY
jgi:hypothetical protein